MDIISALAATVSPGAAATRAIRPADVAFKSVKSFMDSRTATVCPAVTSSPTSTMISAISPGIGAITVEPSPSIRVRGRVERGFDDRPYFEGCLDGSGANSNAAAGGCARKAIRCAIEHRDQDTIFEGGIDRQVAVSIGNHKPLRSAGDFHLGCRLFGRSPRNALRRRALIWRACESPTGSPMARPVRPLDAA